MLNAVIAIVLGYGRIRYSSARDRAFPGPVSGWMSWAHPRFKSPWLPMPLALASDPLYWAVVILPQKGRAWNLRQAAVDDAIDPSGRDADAAEVVP